MSLLTQHLCCTVLDVSELLVTDSQFVGGFSCPYFGRILDVSRNQLTSSIPDGLTRLVNLA
jgi:hypothetical protein